MALTIGTKELKAVVRSYRPVCRTYPESERLPAVEMELDIGVFLKDEGGNPVRGPLGQEAVEVLATKRFSLNQYELGMFLLAKMENPAYQVLASEIISEDTPMPDDYPFGPLSWMLVIADHNSTLPWTKLAQWAVDVGKWVL